MKLLLIKILNKILILINKVFKPKARHTKQELEQELNKLKRWNK